MTKLCQIVAVTKGVGNKTEQIRTGVYHQLQKAEPLSGITRTYHKLDDADPDLPAERKHVQVTVDGQLQLVRDAMIRLLDVTATRDYGNCHAVADVVVDGQVLVRDAPVSYLLFLEKQLVGLRTILTKLPTLDPAEQWTFNDDLQVYVTDEARTVRTRKVMRNHVLAEATDRHPAQVQPYSEDQVQGYWHTVRHSGAVPAKRVRELANRVDAVLDAVKYAREQANGTEINDVAVGANVLDYILSV